MSDERLHKLGTYFCHFQIRDKYGISFEKFVDLVKRNKWSEYVG